MKNKLIEIGIPRDKIIYIDLGINNSNLKNIQKAKSKQIRFAFIGSTSIHKGIQILIDGFNNIKDASLDIYGFISEENRKKYIKLIKNRNINFRGSFKYNEAWKIFAKVDILIVPSICMENSPLTIKEAFSSRTPVIASNVGGLSEMVEDGKTGLLFKMGDSKDLFEKIRYFIDNSSEIERMGKEIHRVKTIDKHAIEMDNIYRNLLKKYKIVKKIFEIKIK